MSKRSVWKNRPDGRTVRRNKIAGQWTWWTIDFLESPANRVMSLSARRVVDRIRIELAHHGGKNNGKLPVTFRDFHKYGIHWNSIAPAVREAEALGVIRITQYGVASNAEFRIPNMFALTHLPTNDDQTKATEDWRRIKTIEEAEAIAEAARKAPARYGKFPKKGRRPKTFLRYGKRSEPGYGNRISTTEILDTETVALSATETVALSISRGGADTSTLAAEQPADGARAAIGKLVWSTPVLEEVFGDEAERLRLQCEEMRRQQLRARLAMAV
jgi:hypothetical protein